MRNGARSIVTTRAGAYIGSAADQRIHEDDPALVLSADPAGIAASLRWRPVRDLLRSVLAEPRVADAPRRTWLDSVLVAAFAVSSVLEGAFRPDVPWRIVSVVLSLGLLPTLPWRRTHPLPVVVIAFGSVTLMSVAQFAIDHEGTPGLNSMAYLLVLPYALSRWGSGREWVVGAAVVVAAAVVGTLADRDTATVGDVIGAFAVIGASMALGAAVRYRSRARQRELAQVKMQEREQIARDLHDTVAHHVSAIAIRAQAGIAVAPSRPDAAIDALRVIEAEASRTLAEMRAMVGVLRRDQPAELAPTPTLGDVERLGDTGGDPAVVVEVAGDVNDVAPSVATAIYRLAQESVTNARRHARRATRISVGVIGDDDAIRLRVVDDGDPVTPRQAGAGYGIVGMMERADLLGGTCEAGPGLDRGWVVTACIPRAGVPR